MEVTLYKSFSKRINSTANPQHHSGPAVGGYVKNLTIKANFGYENQNQSTKCDLIRPSFFLADVEDYVYLKAWDWYYFIVDVSYDINGAQYIECELDVLGTWRDEIMATRSYITYSTKIFNKYIRDARTVPTNNVTLEVFDDNLPEIADDSEMGYLLTVMESFDTEPSSGSITTYYMTLTELDTFVGSLIDATKSLISSLVEDMQDALSCVKTLRVSPLKLSALNTRERRTIRLGKYNTGVEATPLDRQYISENDGISYTLHDDYTDSEPFATARVYLPMVGCVNIPMWTLMHNTSLGYRYYINVETGRITYTLFRGQSSPGNAHSTIIGTYSGSCAFEIPLGLTAMHNPLGGSIAALGAGALLAGSALATGGATTVLAGIMAGASVTGVGLIETAIQQDNHIIGNFEGNYGWGMCKRIKLEIERNNPNVSADNLKELYGRECREVHLISDLYDEDAANYCRTDGFSIDISALKEIKELINSAMDNGVYLE